MEKPRQTFGQPNIYFIREKMSKLQVSKEKNKKLHMTHGHSPFYCFKMVKER